MKRFMTICKKWLKMKGVSVSKKKKKDKQYVKAFVTDKSIKDNKGVKIVRANDLCKTRLKVNK